MLNSLNLNTITALTMFCVNFSDAMKKSSTMEQLHLLTRNTASTLCEENHQHGEIVDYLNPILLAHDAHEARAKMISLSMALIAAAEHLDDGYYYRISDELMRL